MLKAKEVAIESISAFLLGGFPAILTYVVGGNEWLEDFASASLPSGFPVWYVFAISVVAVGALLWKRFRSQRPPPHSVLWASLHELHDELKGVYRFGAGFILTFVAMWIVLDWSSVHLGTLYVAALGLVSLLICIFYRRATDYINSQSEA